MQGSSLHRMLYKWAWDTRCRNIDVSRVLRPMIGGESTILDAGCGEYGLSAFVSAKRVVGVDVIASEEDADGFTFVHGSIAALPFAERSFSIAASVDVLEHLPQAIRPGAIRQLVRVADDAIVVTFPCGELARRADEVFNRELVDSHQQIPDWLAEHLENEYPDTDSVVAEIEQEAESRGRKVKTSVYYSENLSVARFLRWSAVRSKYLYLISNLLSGILLPLLPGANEANAYRSIVVAQFEND